MIPLDDASLSSTLGIDGQTQTTPGIDGQTQTAPTTNGVADEADKPSAIDLESAVLVKGYRHAVHCMLWANWRSNVLKRYDTRAAIMMQMRFDGKFGFPGGMVDNSMDNLDTDERVEQIVDALKRELQEELNLDLGKHTIMKSHYMFSHKCDKTRIIMHFYQYEMSLEDFILMEANAMTSAEFGDEVLGVFRVPIYTMKGNYNGFPAFLDNVFSGNARDQLVEALVTLEIMTAEEVAIARSSSRLGS